MALKFEVSAEDFDSLDDGVKSLYAEKDGKYMLGIEGLPTDNSKEYEERIQKMDSKISELLDEKKKADQKRKEAEEAARKEAEEAARKSGDTDALDKSWQEKYEKLRNDLTAEYEPKVSELNTLLHQKTVMAEATRIASEIALPGSAKALLPHLQSRLAMEVKDGQVMTVVRGVDGKPSALTLDELKNEFVNDPAFAPLIVGSKATGGGAESSNGGGAANKGNLGGTKQERIEAFKARFPELNQ